MVAYRMPPIKEYRRETFPADTAEEAALREAAKAVKALVPESWRDPRMDEWQAQCVALELARRAEGRS